VEIFELFKVSNAVQIVDNDTRTRSTFIGMPYQRELTQLVSLLD